MGDLGIVQCRAQSDITIERGIGGIPVRPVARREIVELAQVALSYREPGKNGAWAVCEAVGRSSMWFVGANGGGAAGGAEGPCWS